ncbi:MULTISPECIES: LPS assembly lipoprotein LptE [Spirosoma]|uniref:LPS assembly lipoprotein LptE n=1 Tax=Spirosoma liriopis TaxID=2937440 RepID=A0ABT0HPT8_9BACT|nr:MULTISPECIES: LPS assembly lipoprotein LptE [Spirosoma]MCK8494193.1 LPS assembly lipoprotein LptE [Spirosoma liriopis]UHG89206.1 LPS assembly lipoprotein LptE [Spirosoma oryzicola]
MKNKRQPAATSQRPAVSLGRLSGRHWLGLLLVVGCSLFTTSCGVYSFTGTTLSPDIKTVTVNNFVLATAGGPANLPLTFNERLKEYYQRYTNLKVVPNNGDMVLEGNITGYDLLAVAPTAQDQAGVNRLQITVLARFYNNKDESKNFEQSFSFYQDFPQNQTLSQNESRLIPKILDQIVLDIFNKTAADW